MKTYILITLLIGLIFVGTVNLIQWGEQTKSYLTFGMTTEQVNTMLTDCEKSLPRNHHCKVVISVEEAK